MEIEDTYDKVTEFLNNISDDSDMSSIKSTTVDTEKDK